MAARDLPYQCQTQPGSAAVGRILGEIEGPEYVFKFRWRHAGEAVPYRDDGGGGIAREPHPGGRVTMAAGAFGERWDLVGGGDGRDGGAKYHALGQSGE